MSDRFLIARPVPAKQKHRFYNYVVTDRQVSSLAKLVLSRLLFYYFGPLGVMPGQAVLADDLGLCVREIRRCVKELQDRGYLSVRRRVRTRRDRRNRTNLMIPMWPGGCGRVVARIVAQRTPESAHMRTPESSPKKPYIEPLSSSVVAGGDVDKPPRRLGEIAAPQLREALARMEAGIKDRSA